MRDNILRVRADRASDGSHAGGGVCNVAPHKVHLHFKVFAVSTRNGQGVIVDIKPNCEPRSVSNAIAAPRDSIPAAQNACTQAENAASAAQVYNKLVFDVIVDRINGIQHVCAYGM